MSWSIFQLKHQNGFLTRTRKPNLRISIRRGCHPRIAEEFKSIFRNSRSDDRGADFRISPGMAPWDSRGRAAGAWRLASKGARAQYHEDGDTRRIARRRAPGVDISGCAASMV